MILLILDFRFRGNDGSSEVFSCLFIQQRLMKLPCVYILTNKPDGTLYIGVTSNLSARIFQHKNDLVDGFSKKYNLHLLVYYEVHENMYSAITREKCLKKWNRDWKIQLIESVNPAWRDLYTEII